MADAQPRLAGQPRRRLCVLAPAVPRVQEAQTADKTSQSVSASTDGTTHSATLSPSRATQRAISMRVMRAGPGHQGSLPRSIARDFGARDTIRESFLRRLVPLGQPVRPKNRGSKHRIAVRTDHDVDVWIGERRSTTSISFLARRPNSRRLQTVSCEPRFTGFGVLAAGRRLRITNEHHAVYG